MNDGTNEYNITNAGNAIPSSKFYLVSYNKLTLTNLFYNDKFIQNEQMKQKITVSYNNIQTIVVPDWGSEMLLLPIIGI